MTTITVPNAKAWLPKKAPPLGPLVVRLDGDRVDVVRLAPRKCLVVVCTTATALHRAPQAYPRLVQEL
jgi:hypothetical protein